MYKRNLELKLLTGESFKGKLAIGEGSGGAGGPVLQSDHGSVDAKGAEFTAGASQQVN